MNDTALFNKPNAGRKINWGHPHAKGLVFAALFNEGSGLPFDSVNGLRGAPTGAIQWRRGGLYFASSSGIYVDFGTHQTIPGLAATDPCTVVIGAIVDNSTGSTGPVVLHGYRVGINTSNRFLFAADYDTTDLAANMTGFNLLQPGQSAFSYRGDATAANVARYRDGHVQATTSNTNPSGSFVPGSSVRIGQFQGVILYAYIYNRVLPGGRVADIHGDPYAMYRPTRRLFVPATAGMLRHPGYNGRMMEYNGGLL